jgi:hypothetical protein
MRNMERGAKKQVPKETGMHDPSSRPIKWRWYRVRLSIRAMIVLVVVVGCSLGWVVHRTRVQRDAVNAVMGVGGRGEVSYD